MEFFKRFAYQGIVAACVLALIGSAQAQELGVGDKPLAAYRTELLDTAFETASAFPIVPHIKNRSRAQEHVVRACFELDQPNRALDYIVRIENWRRGQGYAELARYLVEARDADDVAYLLARADEVANARGLKTWRRNRIRMKIAEVRVLLGHAQRAAQLTEAVQAASGREDHGTTVGESDATHKHTVAAAAQAAEARMAHADEFDAHIIAFDAWVASGHYEVVRNALTGYARLYDRFYDDRERRAIAERKMKDAWETVPVFVRLNVTIELANIALDHSDRSEALRLVDEAQQILDGARWRLHDRIHWMARLAGLRFRAGDAKQARADLDAALALFREKKEEAIKDHQRAAALRPIAEAYATMDDKASALEAYRLTTEQGALNPNIRPRSEDLSETCASMAVHAVEPDRQLWSRIRQIKDELERR